MDSYYENDNCEVVTCVDEPQLIYILTLLKEYIKLIVKLVENTNDELEVAKRKYRTEKEKDIYFENWRRDTFLHDFYFVCFDIFIIQTELYLNGKHNDYDKLINYLDIIVGKHESTIKLNKFRKSNAMIHFSKNGLKLINSFDFTKLKHLILQSYRCVYNKID